MSMSDEHDESDATSKAFNYIVNYITATVLPDVKIVALADITRIFVSKVI